MESRLLISWPEIGRFSWIVGGGGDVITRVFKSAGGRRPEQAAGAT